MMKGMRIVIVGAGGVGGLLAGLLARSGFEVGLVARGAHLAALRAGGLVVDSSLGGFTVRPGGLRGGLSDDPSALAPADVVLVAVKAWQVEEVAPRLAPLVAPGGLVIPLQNGVLAAARLAAALGEERVAGGLIYVLAWIDGPGRVKHLGTGPRLTVGERGAAAGRASPRLDALAAALGTSGCEVSVTADIERETWEKYLLIEPWGTVASAARAPVGAVRSVPETRELLLSAMRELVTVARARGVAVPDAAIDHALAILDAMPRDGTASMQRDLAAGRPSELDDQAGALVRMAREAGVSVPVHEALHAALLPLERVARGVLPPFPRT
jgi:2-dehydropantoate 2-reductase